MATCARPDGLRAGMMRLSALIPAHSGNGGPRVHFVVPSAGARQEDVCDHNFLPSRGPGAAQRPQDF